MAPRSRLVAAAVPVFAWGRQERGSEFDACFIAPAEADSHRCEAMKQCYEDHAVH